MILQAYCDESFSDSVYAVGGYIASAESWAAFSEDWKFRLPHAYIDENGVHQFKMREMMKSEERKGRIPWFYRLIEEHIPLAISVCVNRDFFSSVKNRIWVDHPDFDWSRVDMNNFDDPYFVCCLSLMQSVAHRHVDLAKVVSGLGTVDFYFDDKSEKRKILLAWDDFMKGATKEDKARFGARPRFEDDKDFLPLQAADMWAWWIRETGERSIKGGGRAEKSILVVY